MTSWGKNRSVGEEREDQSVAKEEAPACERVLGREGAM